MKKNILKIFVMLALVFVGSNTVLANSNVLTINQNSGTSLSQITITGADCVGGAGGNGFCAIGLFKPDGSQLAYYGGADSYIGTALSSLSGDSTIQGSWSIVLGDMSIGDGVNCQMSDTLTECQARSTTILTIPFTITGGSGGAGSLGISFFKPASETGSYQPTSFINQSASALGATTSGLGPILAIIGGILVAFGMGGYILATFQEVREKKIKK